MVPEALTFKEWQITLPARDAGALNVGMQEPTPLSDPSSIPDTGPSLRKFLCGNPLGTIVAFS